MKGIFCLAVVSSIGLLSCESGKDTRELISGSEMKGAASGSGAPQNGANAEPKPDPAQTPPPLSSNAPNGNGTGNGPGNGPGNGTGSGPQGGVSNPNIPTPSAPTTPPSSSQPPSGPGAPQTPPPAAVSLEVCANQKKAWPAVVNQKQPTQCGDQLVDWCCTREEIKARFPTLALTLEEKFKKQADTDQFVLYQCSFNLTGSPQKGIQYTFHFAKIVEPQIFYQPINVYNIAATTPAQPQNPCPPPVTVDKLKKPTTLPAPDFGAVIKPILDAKCGGTTCHGAATTLGAALDFSVPANLKKANQAFLFSMPPVGAGKPPLTGAEVKVLTDYMAAP